MNNNSDEDTAVFGDDDRERLPRLVGYEVLELVGQDGLDVVYRARQLSLDRDVAIRTNHSVVDEAQAAQRLIEEAAILAKLQHPHIVSILDCLDRRGRIYLVLEYAAGGTLASRVDGQLQPPVLAAGIVERLARTLAFIHRSGITHCDLKPRNVLLAAPPSNETTSQTGQSPFHGRISNVDSLRELKRNQEPEPVSKINSDARGKLEAICQKCLRPQPESRYPNALDLAQDLREFLRR